MIAVVSAVVVVLGIVVQDAVVRFGSPAPGVDASAPGVDAGVLVLTLVIAAVGAAPVGAVIGVLAALVARRPGLGDRSARAGVMLVAVVVVTAVVALITQDGAYSVWLWAMVPVSALAGLVLARRLVPLDG